MTQRSHHHCKGLTLIELAAVTVLLGLFAVMLSISARGFGDVPAVHAAQLSIEQAWTQVRMQARARHRPTALVFEVGASRVGVVLDGMKPSSWIDLGGVKISRAGFRGVSPVTAGPFTLKLSASGSALPWAIQLERGSTRCVLAGTGVTGRIHAWPDRSLEQVDLHEEIP